MMSDEVKSKHRYSTAALAFMMFILVGGAVIAALSGGGTPGYLSQVEHDRQLNGQHNQRDRQLNNHVRTLNPYH